MKGTKAVLATALASAVLGFAGPAAAQAGVRNAYVGATIGQAEYKDGCSGLASCDEKDTAWRIIGGYQFNRHFAAELGYHDLGEASASTGAAEGSAWELVGVGSYRLSERFSAYGKLGGYRGKLEGRGADESNTDLTYGAGLRYDLTRSVGLRVEWQRYSKMGGGALVETDVDVLGTGILYRFQ